MNRGVRRFLGLAAGLALLPWGGEASAAGPDRAAPTECAPGEPCACSGAVACERTCVPDPKRPGKGCDFTCAGPGSCTFHCPGGRCTSRSTGAGATELTCEGGSCTMVCAGVAACDLNDCKHGCKLVCSGAGVCANSCTGPGCSCKGRNCEEEPVS